MRLRHIPIFAAAGLVALVASVTAPSAAQGPPDGFSLPPQAAEVAPGVFFLGTAVDDGVPVVGFAYAHHKDGHGGGPGGPGGDPEPSPCYEFIANGAHWQVAEDVEVDPSSNPNLGVSVSDVDGWMRAWESQTAVSGIYGGFGPGSGLSADTTSTDGRNEVYFDTIAEPGVLGFTIVWSIRRGPPSARGIVEADIVVEDGEWNWWIGEEGDGTIGGGELDLTAVFIHEAGHYVGMGHTEDPGCEAETMYPSLVAGDDTKQSLGDGDIAGVEDLYH